MNMVDEIKGQMKLEYYNARKMMARLANTIKGRKNDEYGIMEIKR